MLKEISYIFDKKQKRNIIILFLLIMVGSFVELLGVSMIMPLVAIISDQSVITTKPIYIWFGNLFHLDSAREFVLAFAILLILIYILKNIYVSFEYDLQYKFTFHNQRRLSTQMMDCYIHQEYLFHVENNAAELQRNITTDVFNAFYTILYMLQLMTEALVCLVLVVYLLFTDFVTTAAVAGLLGVFLMLFMSYFKKYSANLGVKNREALARQNKSILEAFAGIKEIKVANREQFFLQDYDKASALYADTQRKQSFATVMPRPIMESICICGLLAVMAIRIYMGTDMTSFIPVLSVFVVAAYRMLPSFNRIASYYSSIMFGKPAIHNIYNDLHEIEKYNKNRKYNEEKDFVFSLTDAIEISHISFQYPEGKENVLQDVSFQIPLHQSIALIGPSGAGKTTLADIILGVLEPQQGDIQVHGVSVLEHTASWHRKIGYIPQMIYLTDDTIRNNVAFGIAMEDIDDEKVWKALREAQLDTFVRELPKQLDTPVGERGVCLSGGQRQRVGIARALYHEPELLVFDEATSALDHETETAVMQAIDNLHGSRTMIIIAHRLTTIQNCDIVYEVNHKNVTRADKNKILQELNRKQGDNKTDAK